MFKRRAIMLKMVRDSEDYFVPVKAKGFRQTISQFWVE
jgi:hypothetical protein